MINETLMLFRKSSLSVGSGGYRSHVWGSGQPEMSLGMLRQSRQSRSFSHFSTASPGEYLMDSWRETSCRERAAAGNEEQSVKRRSVRLLSQTLRSNWGTYLLPAWLCWWSCSLPTGSADCRHSAASTAESASGRGSVRFPHTWGEQQHHSDVD